jgi:hypothetical protein
VVDDGREQSAAKYTLECFGGSSAGNHLLAVAEADRPLLCNNCRSAHRRPTYRLLRGSQLRIRSENSPRASNGGATGAYGKIFFCAGPPERVAALFESINVSIADM